LDISSGTSKSNLHKARQKLKQMILEAENVANNRNYNKGMDYSSSVAINKVDIHNLFTRKNI
jgi:hypothetical protein